MTTQAKNLIAVALPFPGLADVTIDALAASAERIDHQAGDVIYAAGAASDFLFIVASGAVRLERFCGGEMRLVGLAHRGEAFGWTALGEAAARRHRVAAADAVTLLRLRGATIIDLVTSDPGAGRVGRDDVVAALKSIQAVETLAAGETKHDVIAVQKPSAIALAIYRTGIWLRSPKPWLALLGYACLFGFWHLAVDVLKLPRFAEMPGPGAVLREFLSPNPTYGVSIYTPVYYQHILISLRRVAIAFVLATAFGVPTGLLLGWSKTFRDYVFPLFEMLRPIPILAWVPLAIVMLPGSELPVLYLTFLASFFATALNTMLGVRSIDPSYVLAAQSLGATRWQVFRHVVVPGALPFVFTGLQISIGVAWFSLVAAEMVSGQFGLGYLINTSYTMVQYPTIVIAMITLGAVGYATSAAVRLVGRWLMDWRERQLAMAGVR